MANLEIPKYHSDGSLSMFAPMILKALFEHGSKEIKDQLYWKHLYNGGDYPTTPCKRFHLINEDGRSSLPKDNWYQGRNIVFVQEGKNFAPTVQAEIMFIQMFLWSSKPYVVLNHLDPKRIRYVSLRADLCDFAQAGGYKDIEELAQEHPPQRGFKSSKRTLVSWTGLDFLYPKRPQPSVSQKGQTKLF